MTDRYAHIREALEALDAAGGDWIAWETAFAKYAKASQPDTIRALLDERDALREALKELITWIPSADTYRHLGFDPEAPMRALGEARAALAISDGDAA